MNKSLLKLLLVNWSLLIITNLQSQTFSNSSPITINGTGTAPVAASLYPSNIVVSGLTGTIIRVTVGIHGFTHVRPGDVDMLLVGPAGQTLTFWSDAGGSSFTNTVNDITISVDDLAPNQLADGTTVHLLTSGPFRPTNYGSTEDVFASPAPAGPYNNAAPFGASTLSLFNGTNPNGTWSLYVSNDANSLFNGSISGGWTLDFTIAPPAAPLIISEFRLRGPAGENDEYIEIYNTSTNPYTVAAASGTGLGVAASDGTTRGVIPNGTIIPAHGHYLIANSSGYSLANYGGTGAAANNATYTTGIPDNAGIALFNNNVGGASYSLANRIDAVGSSDEVNTIYKEGTGYAPLSISGLESRFRRKTYDGSPKDTDNNATDFEFGDKDGTADGIHHRLGAPGPENLNSPVSRNSNIIITRLDQVVGPLAPPNAVRNTTPGAPGTNSTFGTIEFRYRLTNNTGAALTRIRFRLDSLTTFPAGIGKADLRALNSSTGTLTGILDPATCTSTGLPTTVPCQVTVQGTTLEQPPTQAQGGGFNSTLTLSLPSGLAPGASINFSLRFGVIQAGSYSIMFTPEVLPHSAAVGPIPPPEKIIGATDPITCTMNQGSGQTDPTSASPINFTAVFSEAVTGFTSSDVTLSGTAGATTVVITEIAPNNGTTYNVAVSGMTSNGTVIATIPANTVLSASDIGNSASTSTDNTITYALPSPVPTITCPANSSVLVNENCLGSFTLNINTVSFTGSPTPIIGYNWTIFQNYPSQPTQGSVTNIAQVGSVTLSGLPGGASITATATNGAGTASCSFNVAFVDNVAPAIICNNRTASVNPDCVVDISYSFSLSDNCTNASPLVYSSRLFNDGGVSTGGSVSLQPRRFSKGVFYDTIRVEDFNGNRSSCPYTITVVDGIRPEFVSTTCQNIFVNTAPTSTDCSAVANFFPVAEDNCDGLASVITNIPSGSQFPVGITPVIATATDGAGNTAQCSFTVTVIDRTPPQINCPPPQTLYTTSIICRAVLPDYTNSENLAWDNCGIKKIEQSMAPLSALALGQHNISLIATDLHDNIASCPVQITVIDNVPPIIRCKPPITLHTVPGQCYAEGGNLNIENPSVEDNCEQVLVNVNRSDGLALNANYPAGVTIIKWTATDASQNTTSCAQTVTVIDNQPPVIADISANPYILWPPNHKMKDVEVRYTSNDNCGVVSCRLEVSSSEPINGTGDGDTDPDWEIIDDHHVKLRAERATHGDGRIYTITIICTDEQGNETRETVTVRVAHNITAPQSGRSFKVGSTVAFTGEFWDKPGNTHSAKWLIDGSAVANGIVTEPSGNHKGKVTGAYKFKSAGVYKLQMNVTDQTGVTSYANTNEDVDAIVVIYDPNGGNVYGGGHFNSPAGALISNANATGKASYGFAMNYFKNSTYPKGETQFEFKVGEFEFNALNFDYLVISNSMAQFKGIGKIVGGQSGIAFIMTVVDGQLDGTGIDKIRMKIYNKNNGKIIYDNQPGDSDAALPTQAIGPNSTIVISGTNASLTKSNTTTHNVEMEATDKKVPDDPDVSVYPNPASSYFNIVINSNNAKEKIVLQVFDQYGRSIETRANLITGSAVRLGDLYRAGVYYVRIIQGKRQRELKLVKL